MSEADMSEADMCGTYIVGANLVAVNLNGADLTNANLKDDTGITIEELEKQAKSLEGTIMPDGSVYI